MTATNPPLDPDPPLPVRPTAATYAYWLMPGAVTLGSAPKYDRLIGSVALGPAPDRDFYERVELYHTEIRAEYDRADEVAWERQHQDAARPSWPFSGIMPLFDQWTVIPAGFFACSVGFAFLWLLQPSSKTLGPVILCSLLTIASLIARARGFPILTPRSRALIMPEGPPINIPAQVHARITLPPEVLVREAPLITCQVCQAARLAYDSSSGMTVCPGCGTALPLYHWPIEMPTPDEEV